MRGSGKVSSFKFQVPSNALNLIFGHLIFNNQHFLYGV
jgi:hypothetical protein